MLRNQHSDEKVQNCVNVASARQPIFAKKKSEGWNLVDSKLQCNSIRGGGRRGDDARLTPFLIDHVKHLARSSNVNTPVLSEKRVFSSTDIAPTRCTT
ncbi:hypothetical protein PsorP6_002697 [Peronosclerospora sorghi]|uniref:Uncharacterized protein n=1 Tax=Peronosclerospora sorghi TaxID=230839 RepID=A0ACC0WWH4_9STRA|nr:hypothetical protein PsorP6_002697 [Peronosclerospora sorghi]